MRLIDLLNKHIDECYKKYTSVDLKQLETLKKIYYESRITEKSMYPLVLYIIKNNTLDVCVESDNKLYNKNNNLYKIDERIPQIFDLINRSLLWARKNDKHIPDTTIYFWMSDRIPWIDIDKRIPIFVFAKPINRDFIIFPDNTFSCMTIHKKYSGI